MSRNDKRDKKKNILEELKKNSEGKYILPLSQPVDFGDDKITELELDEPKAKHIRNLPGDPLVDDVLKICADLAHQPDSVIDELCMKDVGKLTDYFEAFN